MLQLKQGYLQGDTVSTTSENLETAITDFVNWQVMLLCSRLDDESIFLAYQNQSVSTPT